MVVDLPAPFGPSRATVSPGDDVEVDAGDGPDRAVGLGEAAEAQSRGERDLRHAFTVVTAAPRPQFRPSGLRRDTCQSARVPVHCRSAYSRATPQVIAAASSSAHRPARDRRSDSATRTDSPIASLAARRNCTSLVQPAHRQSHQDAQRPGDRLAAGRAGPAGGQGHGRVPEQRQHADPLDGHHRGHHGRTGHAGGQRVEHPEHRRAGEAGRAAGPHRQHAPGPQQHQLPGHRGHRRHGEPGERAAIPARVATAAATLFPRGSRDSSRHSCAAASPATTTRDVSRASTATVSAAAVAGQRRCRAYQRPASTAAHATGSVRSRPSEIGIPAGTASTSPVSGCRPSATASRTANAAATVRAATLTSSSASTVETPGQQADRPGQHRGGDPLLPVRRVVQRDPVVRPLVGPRLQREPVDELAVVPAALLRDRQPVRGQRRVDEPVAGDGEPGDRGGQHEPDEHEPDDQRQRDQDHLAGRHRRARRRDHRTGHPRQPRQAPAAVRSVVR